MILPTAPAPAKFEERLCAALSSLLERDDVLILDTETTGLSQAEVIEVSVIDTRGEILLDTLVRPRARRMNPYAQRVHGVSLDMLDDQPNWPDVLPELRRLTDRATVLAWNAPFDARMLEATSAGWGLTHPSILFACAMRMYARLKGSKRSGLHRAVKAEGLEHLLERHRSHRALGDVHFVLEVLRKCTTARDG
ncbi:MAG: 3'-5' exonuclease [Deinococcota bacterium]|nr:3'-5' exonuclease [Deinococcota bacterium]